MMNIPRIFLKKFFIIFIFDFYYHFFIMPLLSDDGKSITFTKKEIILRGTIIAMIITIPSLVSFCSYMDFI